MSLTGLALRGPIRNTSALGGEDDSFSVRGFGLSSYQRGPVERSHRRIADERTSIASKLRKFMEGLAEAVAPILPIAIVGGVGVLPPGHSTGPATYRLPERAVNTSSAMRQQASIPAPAFASRPREARVDNISLAALARGLVRPDNRGGPYTNFASFTRRFDNGGPSI